MVHDPGRSPLPGIPAPPPYAERRRAFRRVEDLTVQGERALLARALDILAAPGDAATHVAEILALVSRAVGARRAALVTDRPVRRVLVVAGPGEDPGDARRLAAWLDVHATRSAAARAAAVPAEITVVRSRQALAVTPFGRPPTDASDRFMSLDARAAGVQLGLELADAADRATVAARLQPAMIRHLLAALAAASARAADEDERAALRAREHERERFVSMVAHELRTPLTGLGGYLDLLADGAVDDPEIGREFIERGRGIVERMAALVGDLLELSRVEAGSLRLDIEPVSLAEACERALVALAPVAAERRVRLVVELPPRLRTARADRRRVEQIVTNLVGNALKFTADGGLVDVVGRIERDVALVVVRDDGPGIEPGDRERAFRPFTRLARDERVPGTGLGLPISRDLARAMGGDVAVASVVGSGSSFLLGLPASEGTTRGMVTAMIAGAVEREQVVLEEREILRVLRTGARSARGPVAPADRPDAGALAARPAAIDAA